MINTPVRIVALSGSTRRDSYNRRLIQVAVRGAEEAGAEVTVADLRDFNLPLFDEDLERDPGTPASARNFKAMLVASDGLMIASPEYNSSITAVLKNAIDWASRPAEGEPPLVAFRGKVAAIMSASPGGFGGLRGLVHLLSILGNIGVIVLPDQVSVPKAAEAFREDGSLVDSKQQSAVKELGQMLVSVVAMLKCEGGKE